MALYYLLFAFVKTSRLVENSQRYAGLADIMEGCRQPYPLDVRVREFDAHGESYGDACYQQTVLKCSLVIAAHIVKPPVEPIALDSVDHLNRRVIGVRQPKLFAPD